MTGSGLYKLNRKQSAGLLVPLLTYLITNLYLERFREFIEKGAQFTRLAVQVRNHLFLFFFYWACDIPCTRLVSCVHRKDIWVTTHASAYYSNILPKSCLFWTEFRFQILIWFLSYIKIIINLIKNSRLDFFFFLNTPPSPHKFCLYPFQVSPF